jgi:hypothetical protein
MKSGQKLNKSNTSDPRKTKEDFLRWLARKKKTAVADPEVKPVSPPPTEALMVWADDGGPTS